MIYTTIMMMFDASKPWVILVPPDIPAAKTAAEELAHGIGALRGPGGAVPSLADASAEAPGEGVPIIVLNGEAKAPAARNGFAWRVGRNRIEIYGDSGRGLCNGIFDFLAALGIRWPDPHRQELPPFRADGSYDLKDDRPCAPSRPGPAERRRLFLTGKDVVKEGEALARWAARNRIDALVLSLREPPLARLFGIFRRARRRLQRCAEKYSLIIEAGGWDLSLLAPRRYFFSRPELFRMDSGKRRRDFNFCPTNPDTIRLLKKGAEKLFHSRQDTEVFHLWPDQGAERTWCSCPSCRAFSPAEQNRIAVNAAAEVLFAVNPAAFIAFYETSGEESSIPLRPNLFALGKVPGEGGAEKSGFFSPRRFSSGERGI